MLALTVVMGYALVVLLSLGWTGKAATRLVEIAVEDACPDHDPVVRVERTHPGMLARAISSMCSALWPVGIPLLWYAKKG